ncbi:MAG: hypothetical protein AAGI34_17570 [Pseudomonadota bacterium]
MPRSVPILLAALAASILPASVEAERSSARLSCYQEGVLVLDRQISDTSVARRRGHAFDGPEGQTIVFERAGAFCTVFRARRHFPAPGSRLPDGPVILGPVR